jgi:hypothetical protein
MGNHTRTTTVPAAMAAAVTTTDVTGEPDAGRAGIRHRHRHQPTVTTSRIATNHMGPVPSCCQAEPENSAA